MKRKLFTLLAAISLLVCISLIACAIFGTENYRQEVIVTFSGVHIGYGKTPGGLRAIYVIGLSSVLPFLWLIARRAAKRRVWVRANMKKFRICTECGYDLRATPERCPECGLVPKATP